MRDFGPLWLGGISAIIAGVVVAGALLSPRLRRHFQGRKAEIPSLTPPTGLAPSDQERVLLKWVFKGSGLFCFCMALIIGFGAFSGPAASGYRFKMLALAAVFYAASVFFKFLAAGRGGRMAVARQLFTRYFALAAFVVGFIEADIFTSSGNNRLAGISEVSRRLRWMWQGGTGETANWGEPFFYYCLFGGVPVGLIFALVALFILKLIGKFFPAAKK